MRSQILQSWPLFFGLALMMVGNSLQGTLLGVRADIENFSVFTTGLIMSAYYIGFLGGSYLVPKLVANVGHIRVFAALASIASTTVLLHAVFVDPWIWGLTRIVTGFAYAGLYIVVESWLNDAATNETRGKMLGLYMFITYAGMVVGQLLLNLADPATVELFVLTSVLVSLALLPISLSKRPAPDFSAGETIWFSTIWKRSPLGVTGMFISGFASASFFSLGAIYILQSGLTAAFVSTFIAAFIIGGVLIQLPVSSMSDKMDRRKVIIALSFLSAIAMGILFMGGAGHTTIMLIGAMCVGAFSLPIYGQCASHVNDHLLPKQFVAASATLLLINGVGAAIAPTFVSSIMQVFGPSGFIVSIAMSFGALFIFGMYRYYVGDAVPVEDRREGFLMPARGSSFSLYNKTKTKKYKDES
jgi:MFS family permease